MKLIDLVNDIEHTNEELIVFQENTNDSNSNIILSNGEGGKQIVKDKDGRTYYYLIEVYLAKEFIEDLIKSKNYSIEPDQIARRLHHYAINDA